MESHLFPTLNESYLWNEEMERVKQAGKKAHKIIVFVEKDEFLPPPLIISYRRGYAVVNN